MSMKKQHIIMISVDALSQGEFNLIKNLPSFKEFVEEGAYAKKVYSVYPSLTYTCHTSILTGTYPAKHGIFSNYKFQPFKKEPDWFWYAKDIQVETLVDLVKAQGGTIGSVFWPVMAGNKKIDWNSPEVWSNNPKDSQIKVSLNAGSKCFQIKMALKFLKYLPGLIGKKQPTLDEYITQSAYYMIKKYKPTLSLIHLIELDHIKHVHGAEGDHISSVLRNIDNRIHRLISATKEAGIYENCTFILLGDHSNLSYANLINLNTLFVNNGLIQLDGNGQIKDWQAYSASCDGSAQIFIQDHDPDIAKKVYTLLRHLQENEKGIERVLTKKELLNQYGTGGPFEFMVEAKKGYCFAKNTGPFDGLYDTVDDLINQGHSIHKGHHGYDPYKPDYQTLFFAKGKHVKPHAVIQEMSLVDIAPTVAKLMGIEMKNVDGVCQDIVR